MTAELEKLFSDSKFVKEPTLYKGDKRKELIKIVKS